MHRLTATLCLFLGLWAIFSYGRVMAETIGTVTGLPIPRYVTLRSSEVNVRAGPGSRYPIEWVFQRPDLPVEVVSEFDTWRKIRDVDGTEGWVHQSMLSGRRGVVVLGQIRTLHREPNGSAPAVARLEPGVIGKLEVCHDEWCEIEISGFDGWIHRSHIWGVRVDEALE
jgi:SH3-like domain-containing protein